MRKKVFRIIGGFMLIALIVFVYKAISTLIWVKNANRNFYNLTLKAQLVDENGKEIKKQGKVFLTKYVGSDDYDLDPISVPPATARLYRVEDKDKPLRYAVVFCIFMDLYCIVD